MHAHLVQMAGATAELEELREMKEDVERRERAQAAVIENQAKRLEELETLYKVPSHALHASPFTACYQLAAHTVVEQPDVPNSAWQFPGRCMLSTDARLSRQDESIMRKKYFNQMEDMKGKIRVYARVRPMLGFEAERGQKAWPCRQALCACAVSYGEVPPERTSYCRAVIEHVVEACCLACREQQRCLCAGKARFSCSSSSTTTEHLTLKMPCVQRAGRTRFSVQWL